MPRVSIVVRSFNEERWIGHCLRAVYAQRYRDFEVVLVDNRSTDGTLARALQHPVRLVHLDAYRPGRALNLGIEHGTGEIIVCLSGHCVPADEHWLARLVAGLDDDSRIAGVYGRQLPMRFSSAHDKRDLMITFGLDRRVQIKDSFFHNANSALRRSLWEACPFDDEAPNIEDRIWASEMIRRGHRLLYEPEAAVYHHHGIHHGGDPVRADSTVQVIERLQGEGELDGPGLIPAREHRVIGLVPAQADALGRGGVAGLDAALAALRDCPLVDRSLVLTDSEALARRALRRGAEVPSLRGPDDSPRHLDLGGLYAHWWSRIEAHGGPADLVVSVEPSFRQRPAGLLAELIELAVAGDHDSVVPVVREYGFAWMLNDRVQGRVDAGDLPRPLKEPLLLAAKGLGLVTRPATIRRGHLIGDRVGLFVIPRSYVSRELAAGPGAASESPREPATRAPALRVAGPEL